MDGFESESRQETDAMDEIFPDLEIAIDEHGVDHKMLKVKKTKAYTALFLANFTVFRLCLRGNRDYISVPILFEDIIPQDLPLKKVKTEPKYIRLMVDTSHPVQSYFGLLIQITVETLNRYPKEWDCCSRYMECSDARICVHPDKTSALACGYRKLLQGGRIFYGKNRNV